MANEGTVTQRRPGQPSTYNTDIADFICSHLAEGKSLRTVLKMDGMPAMSTVFLWLRTHEDFSEQYARAKEESADALADDIIELADRVLSGEVDPNAGRVAGDLKKWSASKLKPKKYGDKVDLTTNGRDLPTPIINIAINAPANTTDDNKRKVVDAEVPEIAAKQEPSPKSNIMEDINGRD